MVYNMNAYKLQGLYLLVFPNVNFDWHVKLKARGKEKEKLGSD